MSPALALMPALPPEPDRARRPEQLTLPSAPFVELLFVDPLFARASCRAPRGATAPAASPTPANDTDLLSWRPAPRPARAAPAKVPARKRIRRPAPPKPEKELRTSRPAPRARVVQPKPLTNQERGGLTRTERLLRTARYAGLPVVLPAARSKCADVPRPCPFVSCTRNNYLDVQPNGSIKLNFAHLEPGEMDPELSCADDIGDRGGVPLEVVGKALNISMERVRQVIGVALAKGREVVGPEDVEFETEEG